MNSGRNFLKRTLAGSAMISLSGIAPRFLHGASQLAAENREENILVVVQLSGGNDGLNTVVPYGDDEYYKNRFSLAIGKNNVLKINDHIGFHPALTGFDKLMQDNRLSVIQGVGYPNPNRSHFESMDLWHTAHRITDTDRLGWLGRSLEASFGNLDLPAVHFGSGLQPLALRTENRPVPSIQSINDFRLNLANNKKIKDSLKKFNASSSPDNPLLGYLRDSSNVAMKTSQRLEGLGKSSRQKFKYPGSSLGTNLSTIAQLIGSGLSTKIYYTTLDGFDTHSNQGPAHQGLLADLGNSINSFMNEIKDQGNEKRVAVLSFSEFGRRVRENASAGTDHGTAAPVFIAGPKTTQAVVGANPDFNNLENGDLKFGIDYRQVYSDVLTNWLKIDAEPILGGAFKPLNLFG